MLTITLLGTAATMPLPDRALTAAVAECGGHSLLFDCGEGTQTAARRAGVNLMKMDAVCLTHYHGDHIFGLPGLLQTLGCQGRTRPLALYGPKGLGEVWAALRVLTGPLPYPVYAEVLDAPAALCEKFGAAAAAVEVFHNFTLLHDDIMDNAAVRRGKPSVYAKWGQNVAILSGDAMLICAYRLLGEVPAQLLPQILSTFNTMALEVCEGQQYDMDFERKPKVSVVEYMHMIELKTSVLLAGATTIGALLGGASEEDCRKLRRFAIELGLAFQLQDDLLDSYGDERLGKAIGGDILEGKQTYLMITAISRADEPTREVLRSTHRSQMPDAEKIATIKAVYDRLDIPRLTEQQISLRFERALGILDTLSVEKSRTERMREYALSLMGRKN